MLYVEERLRRQQIKLQQEFAWKK